MNKNNIKSSISFVLTIVLFCLALKTKDVINRNLFVGLAIIIGAFTTHILSNSNNKNYE